MPHDMHGILGHLDNLISVFMTIGSPALAGYSLVITRLNNEWLIRQFYRLHFPNEEHIIRTLAVLQHIPFRINNSDSLLPSLIVLPQNDRYWELLGVAAKRTKKWSISSIMGINWVLLALALTIVDSIEDFDHFIALPGSAGHSTAAVWLYILPLVIGWVNVGSQPDADQLHDALDKAHEIAYVATAAEPVLATQLHSARGIEPSTWDIDYVNADERKTTPTYNYSRVFIWSQHAEHILRLNKNAANKADRRMTVQWVEEWMDSDNGTILAHNRVGNEAEVVEYCMEEQEAPFDPNPRPGAYTHGRQPRASSVHDEEAPATEAPVVSNKPVFAAGVFHRVVLATVFALCLQWCTTGGAILIHFHTPPKGLGCRAMVFTAYGAAATVAFWLFLSSSVLAHLARRQSIHGRRSGSKAFIGSMAMFTRWLGKFIAIMNGSFILLSSVMQFTGAYDSCFCSSTTLGGDTNGVVRFMEDIKKNEVYAAWNSGLGAAFLVASAWGDYVAIGPHAILRGLWLKLTCRYQRA